MIGHKRWAVRTAVPQSYELKCLHAQIEQINLQMEAGNACNSPVENAGNYLFSKPLIRSHPYVIFTFTLHVYDLTLILGSMEISLVRSLPSQWSRFHTVFRHLQCLGRPYEDIFNHVCGDKNRYSKQRISVTPPKLKPHQIISTELSPHNIWKWILKKCKVKTI